jgi:hypothetical protein
MIELHRKKATLYTVVLLSAPHMISTPFALCRPQTDLNRYVGTAFERFHTPKDDDGATMTPPRSMRDLNIQDKIELANIIVAQFWGCVKNRRANQLKMAGEARSEKKASPTKAGCPHKTPRLRRKETPTFAEFSGANIFIYPYAD